MTRIEAPSTVQAQYYHINSVTSRPSAYEGHMFHDEVDLEARTGSFDLSAGDWYLSLDQDKARYAIETLEPQAHDSFFRWGFFNSVLERKEDISDYVFEDLAAEILAAEPDTRAKFDNWKTANPALVKDKDAVLYFIFHNCQRQREPEWRRYPVLSIV
jgi:hypothetical protein